MGSNEAYQCVGGLYLTVADLLAPLPINNNNNRERTSVFLVDFKQKFS